MAKADSLTRMDWILAATAALGQGGVDSVRVEALARRLKTSKGSFYWHFKDRPDLLEAVLALWEAEGTSDVIAMAADLPTPRERLVAVMEEAIRLDLGGIDVAGFEGALRGWAAQDPAIAERIRIVDARRVSYLTDELCRLGQEPGMARRRAEALYLALLGFYAASRYGSATADAAALRDFLDLAMARP